MFEPESTKKALEIALPFLDKLASAPIEELGLLLQDKVRCWRFNRQVEMLEKAQKTIEKHNIKIKEVSLKVLVPLLEGASLEEDPDLQDMWANLLVNYADSKQQLESTVFPYILGQLSGREAIVLNRFMKYGRKEMRKEVGFNKRVITNFRFDDGNFKRFEKENLVRLGIVEYNNSSGSVEYFDHHYDCVVREVNGYNITALGFEFLKACLEPSENEK